MSRRYDDSNASSLQAKKFAKYDDKPTGAVCIKQTTSEGVFTVERITPSILSKNGSVSKMGFVQLLWKHIEKKAWLIPVLMGGAGLLPSVVESVWFVALGALLFLFVVGTAVVGLVADGSVRFVRNPGSLCNAGEWFRRRQRDGAAQPVDSGSAPPASGVMQGDLHEGNDISTAGSYRRLRRARPEKGANCLRSSL